MNAVLLALAWAIAAPDSVEYCSLFQQRSMRPLAIMELTLRATPDSTRDTYRPPPGVSGVGHRGRLSWDTAAVYGQVFDLITADGELGALQPDRHRQVVLVWWRLGTQCHRVTPRPAVNREVSELFLIARTLGASVPDTNWFDVVYTDLRPESQWINGMPTFDVGDASWLYAPPYRRPVNLPAAIRGDLTVAEFRDYFARLARTGMSREDTEATWRELLRWGDADPRRWTLFPAADALCAAARNLGDTTISRGRCVH